MGKMVKGASLEWRAAAARIWGGVLLGVIICLWAGWGPAYGADLLDRVWDQEIKQVLRLQVGSSKVVKTPFAVTRVSVGNPEIADIVVISDREVYINGRGPTNRPGAGRRLYPGGILEGANRGKDHHRG